MNSSDILKSFCWSGLKEEPDVMKALNEAVKSLEKIERLNDWLYKRIELSIKDKDFVEQEILEEVRDLL